VLHICAEVKDVEITDILFETLKNSNRKRDLLISQDVMGNTPLHICAQKGNEYMCQKLIELYKTLPRSIPGRTPIWLAINYNNLTAFQEAVKNDQLKVVQQMLILIPESPSRKYMIDAIDDQLCTSLHIAASNGKSAIYGAKMKEYITLKFKQFITIVFGKLRQNHIISKNEFFYLLFN
jgi:ankyrin repeat protein